MSGASNRDGATPARKSKVRVGDRLVGDGEPCFIIAEIGINHNGDLEVAKQLIDMAVVNGVDAVKLQKRTLEVVYTEEELARPRESQFGDTNGDLKRGLEFDREEYSELDRYCREVGMMWFASCWDEGSVDFIEQFSPSCYKIASASLTDRDLLDYTASKGRPIILSTGMSTMEQIRSAVSIVEARLGDQYIIMHCTSTYPAAVDELNLSAITAFMSEFAVPIGYSGHEPGVFTSVMAAALGASAVERHITLSRAMWGSDQAASLERRGLELLCQNIRIWERARGDGQKKVYESERPIIDKLRRVDTLGTV